MNDGKTEIFLDGLPRTYKGINWSKTKGYKVKSICNGEEKEFEIVDYERNKKQHLTIKYKDKEFDIHTSRFIRCQFGRILGTYTPDFKVEIGHTFKDYKRDITIVGGEKHGSYKYYKYRCNNPKCGFECGEHYSTKDKQFHKEYWIEESSLLHGNGCACCCFSPQIVVEGINSIGDTAPELVKYFQNPEDAKKYTKSSSQKIKCVCPDCGREKYIIVSDLKQQGLGCSCGDGKSYGEKFLMNVFKQLDIDFESEYSPDWIGKKRYDFYFKYNNEDYICEVHGIQHYKQSSRGRSLEEERENDRFKKQKALDNGIKEENYIVIDARESSIEWIRDNEDGILNSRLSELFDLSKIDWLKVEEFAVKNLVKTVCDLWNNGMHSTKEISNIMKINFSTITKYLKTGSIQLGWCDYDPKEEMRKSAYNSGKLNSKLVEMFKDGEKIGDFISSSELERQSEKLFGLKLLQGKISAVCLGKKPQYKGFTFKYIEKNITTELHNQDLVQAS